MNIPEPRIDPINFKVSCEVCGELKDCDDCDLVMGSGYTCHECINEYWNKEIKQ